VSWLVMSGLRWCRGYTFAPMSGSTSSASFFFKSSGDHRDLHSFPTRRSSDLVRLHCRRFPASSIARIRKVYFPGRRSTPCGFWRSEEHTSELQSRSDLVCRLLLEKKKHEHITVTLESTVYRRRLIPALPHLLA